MSERIGPYRIDRRLGVGGMGVVHEAHDEVLQRRVALKVISPHLADDPDFRTRFVREARAMASLDSAHVVQVFAHGEDDGQLWIASQLIPDGDLGTLLRRQGAPPLPVAVDLVAQVASGLADAHAAGLVHRDIKPANVLLRRRGNGWNAYLADFGIARADTDRGLTQGAVGTPSFMAPELHTGGDASPVSDIYSLGCVLWATLTGTSPFAGTTDYAVVTAHLEAPIPQMEGDSPLVRDVNAVLGRALAKDPARRYQEASALRDDLADISRRARDGETVVRAGVPAAAPAAPAARGSAEPSSRGRRTAGVLAALLVLAVVGGALWAWGPLGRDDTGTPTSADASSPESTAPSDAEPPSDAPSDPPSTPPAEPDDDGAGEGQGGDLTPAQRTAALTSFSTALQTQPMVTPESGDCIASYVVDAVGLDQLVEQGFFDADMTYVDQDLGGYPEMKQALTGAALACAAVGG